MLRFGWILFMICLVASLTLAIVYKWTEPIIAQQKTTQIEESLKIVLPGADSFEEKTLDNKEYYEGFSKNRIIGYVLPVEAAGYSGSIKMLAGFTQDGKITAIAVLEHQETPGLGAKITEIESHQNHPWFLTQFEEKNVNKLSFDNIEAISGATITSKAVVDAVRTQVAEFLEKIK